MASLAGALRAIVAGTLVASIGLACIGSVRAEPWRGRHAGSSRPFTLDAYLRSVHALRLSVDQMAAARDASGARTASLQTRLRSLDRVILPDGRLLLTGTPELADEVQARSLPSIQRMAGALDALDDDLSNAPRVAADTGKLDELDRVLQRAEFQDERNPVQRLWDWAWAAVSGAILRLVTGGPVNASVAWVFAIVFLGLVGVTALLVARGALRRMVVDRVQSGPSGEPVTSRLAGERASERAASGDFRMAFRFLFLATLLELQERRALELRPGRTNREYLQSLSEEPRYAKEFRESLTDLVDAFDRSWYGHLPFGESEYRACEELAGLVLGQAEKGRAA